MPSENSAAAGNQPPPPRSVIDESESSDMLGDMHQDIRKLTQDADAILESIRQTSLDGEVPPRAAPGDRSVHDTTTHEEDDNLGDELSRLGDWTAEIRQSLHDELEQASLDNDDDETLVMELKPRNETLLLSATVVWSIILLLLMYAQHAMLDEHGRMRGVWSMITGGAAGGGRSSSSGVGDPMTT